MALQSIVPFVIGLVEFYRRKCLITIVFRAPKLQDRKWRVTSLCKKVPTVEAVGFFLGLSQYKICLLYTSPSPRDRG